MVSDGTITPSEGARLLEALGSPGFTREKQPTPRKRKTEAGAVLSEIGPIIQEAMGDIFKSSRKTDRMEGLEFQETESYQADLPLGNDLVIYGAMKTGTGIAVHLKPGAGSTLRAFVEGEGSVSYCSQNDKTVLRWKSGDLHVEVPDSAGSVKVVSRGGPIHSNGLQVPVTMNTMGGGISIQRPGSSFSAKTMGGGIEIVLDRALNQNSKAKSMGGSVSVTVSKGIPVIIEASTLGGTIDPGTEEHEILTSSGSRRGGSKMCIGYGDTEDAPRLAVSTMGGDIVIRGKS